MSLFIPGYTIDKEIKHGGCGTVYLGKNIAERKIVAIKIMNPNAAASVKLKMQFAQEIQILSKLQHPYIVRLFCGINNAPRPALAMEFFESDTLKTLILQKSPLLVTHGVGMLRKVAEALKYVHSLNIVHKDIKPENILVNSAGEVRLIDFSLSEKINFFSRFKSRKLEGTPMYIAPEQIQRKCPDSRTDIYSLGATFYEVFAGRNHIQANSDKALLSQQIKGIVPKIRQSNKNVPYQIDNIILRMLKKNPAERYQSMGEMLFDLNKYTTRDYLYLPGQKVADDSESDKQEKAK